MTVAGGGSGRVGSGECRGGGLRGGAGWDALLAAVRRSARRGGHRGVVERGDVAVVADHDAGAVGGDVGGGRSRSPSGVVMSMNGEPSSHTTFTVAWASSGGTE